MARILLVDDEESVLKTVGILLKVENHEVVTCQDGAEAVSKIQNEAFDLLITDIRMDPIDGMEILKIAHDAKPDMPSIVISAYGSEETAQQAKDMGCFAYIRKPFRIDEVLEAVNQGLASA